MRIRLFALWLVLLFTVQGCTKSNETMVGTNIQESTTPIIDPVTATLSPIVLSSATVAVTATPSVVITSTPLLTPEPFHKVQPVCFTMLPALPDKKMYHGKIIFLARGNYERIQDSHNLASLYDLNTRQRMPMDPEKVHNIQVSPDGLTYAVTETADENVKFFSANGRFIRSLSPSEYPYAIGHWLNNQQIDLEILQPTGETYYKYPIDQVIFNPFSGEQIRMIPEQFPDIDVANARMFWEGGSTTKIDPLLTRVVYPAGIKKDYLGKSGIGYVLWDLENQVKLVEIVTGYFAVTPKWALDGSRFVINDSDGDGEFYAVTRDGVVTQLSHLNPDPPAESAKGKYFSDLYNWSPDGRYLAFWLESFQDSSIQGTLAILDTDTGKVIDTCISAGFVRKGVPGLFPTYLQPIWSPDGKSLVTEANRRGDGHYQSVLIDLEGEFAAPLGENIHPVGWLMEAIDMGETLDYSIVKPQLKATVRRPSPPPNP